MSLTCRYNPKNVFNERKESESTNEQQKHDLTK